MLVSSDSKRLLVIATNSYTLEKVVQVQNMKIARGYPSYFQTTSMLMLDISNKTSPKALSMEQVMTSTNHDAILNPSTRSFPTEQSMVRISSLLFHRPIDGANMVDKLVDHDWLLFACPANHISRHSKHLYGVCAAAFLID
jgi:hypothetical protein